ncbi:MAG: sulfotransferase [Polyangiales bacterium]
MPVPDAYRPPSIRLINALGAAARGMGRPLPSLAPENMKRAAMKKTGLSDFGGEAFWEGCRVLVDSLERDPGLTTIGRLGARETIVGYLVNRLQIEQHRQQHPEIARAPVERPVFIVGMPRTGTTLLFNLLWQDPVNRAPMTWEVHIPHPPPQRETFETDPRIAEVEKQFANFERLVPWLPAIHEFGARLPQECVPLCAHEFLSVQWTSTFDVPEYQAWLDGQDVRPAYKYHKRFLQHLQSEHAGQRWVLKSPEHLPNIDTLLEVYPDARIIHTHRDPARVMPSLASLTHALRSLNTDTLNPARIGRQTIDLWSRNLERAVAARRKHADKPAQFFDAPFEETLKDPVDLLRRAYAHFEMELSEDAESRMRVFLAAKPRGSRGKHRYVRQDFELSLEEIRERFADYCDAFDVPLVD